MHSPYCVMFNFFNGTTQSANCLALEAEAKFQG